MSNKLILVITSLFFVSIYFANTISNNDQPIIEIGAYNIRQNNEGNYLIDIYSVNHKPIAGIQFKLLGEDFEILKVDGDRASRVGFQFYIGKKGVILAFSLEGKTVSAVDEMFKKMNPLLTLTVKKKSKEASEFNLQTLIAGKKGVKLESTFIPFLIDVK